MKLILYSYYRSSAAFRVRIALNLKGLPYEIVPVHLTRDGGQHKSDWYRQINPQMRVPCLVAEAESGERHVMVQSPAIVEWIDENWPQPDLLPADLILRQKARAIAAIVGCDIHPLNNSGALNYLKDDLGHTQDVADAWVAHWMRLGFETIESMLGDGPFCCGEQPSIADIFLVPQVANARRFNVPLDAFPKIVAVDAACQGLDAFARAAPANQPDAE